MKKELLLILFVLALNFVFGYFYQQANEVICFTELSFLGLGGLIFWIALYQPIKKFTVNKLLKNNLNTNSLFSFFGIGIVLSLVNLLFCQWFLITSFTLFFGCESPSFQTLHASMTNNVLGNLLCYAALTGVIVYDYRITDIEENNWTEPLPKNDSNPPVLHKQHLVFQRNKSSFRIDVEEIIHVEVNNNTITIFTNQGKFVRYQSLSSFQKELPTNHFKRVHRSAIVNFNYVAKINTNQNGDGILQLTNGEKIRFSRSYKKDFV